MRVRARTSSCDLSIISRDETLKKKEKYDLAIRICYVSSSSVFYFDHTHTRAVKLRSERSAVSTNRTYFSVNG